MTYQQALNEVNKRLRFGSVLGLERISILLEKLGNPQKKLKFVHVAGTNGKGTTCTYISSILCESGYRTGLYTSPYVVDFRERFQINGEMITQEELIRQVEIVGPVADSISMDGEDITEFEFITALALNWYAEKNCDIVVLEVGLGGRFDATNVIDCPLAAVIASISLDHTAILGDTIEKIAFEKAGIVKNNCHVVMYPKQNEKALGVFENICKERGAYLLLTSVDALKILETNLFGTHFVLDGEAYYIPFSGIHQVYNAANAINAVRVLQRKGLNISAAAVKSGLKKASIPARMEILSEKPLIIIDGGHNPGCGEALQKVIEENLKGKKITAIMGMMSDKDSHSYLKDVAPYFSKIITVTPDNPRSMPAKELAEAAKEFCKNTVAVKTNMEAVELALKDDIIIICGSFYMAAELRPIIKKMLFEDSQT